MHKENREAFNLDLLETRELVEEEIRKGLASEGTFQYFRWIVISM